MLRECMHAGADAGQLQHLVVADDVHLARLGHDARVGGVDAVHVGVDLAVDLGRQLDALPAHSPALLPIPCFMTAARATAVVSEPPRPSVVML